MTARYLAVQALLHQEEGGYANLVLDAELKKHPLPDPRDRAFAGAVFYAVLEHQVTLDHILNKFLQKKIEKLDGAVRAILRSGLAQARYMGVPASAAVNEAVKLTRAFKKSSASGLVNAVLRRAIAFDGDLAAEPYQSPAHRLAVLGSVSLPVAEFFLAHYPQSAEEILTGLQPAADTALRANTLRTGEAVLCKALLAEGANVRCPGPFRAVCWHSWPAVRPTVLPFKRAFTMWKARPASWLRWQWGQSPAKRWWICVLPPAAKLLLSPSRWGIKALFTAVMSAKTVFPSFARPPSAWASAV